jgi:hypothetical protein
MLRSRLGCNIRAGRKPVMPTKRSTSSRRRTSKASSARRVKKGGARAASPAARRRAAKTSGDAESHIDGCDIDFSMSEATADADLPPAKGGVAPGRRAVRRK